MKTIVIATTNTDKFTLVSNLLIDLGLNGWNFKKLSDFEITGQVEETGSAMDRAEQKADFFAKSCLEIDGIDVVVGIDDGMILNTGSEVITDSKKITQEILSGDKVKVGEEVVNHRAFCFLLPKTGKKMQATTELKFRFLGNNSGIKLEDGKYPLSYVLGYDGYSKAVNDMSPDEVRELNVKFSKDSLQPIIDELKKQHF